MDEETTENENITENTHLNNEIDIMVKYFYQRCAYSFILERMTGFYLYMLNNKGKYNVKNVERVCVECV